uniref:Uncharacterized protein n=1 Tax=Denticeps clupeoides TaxID=299321 RepID=A0AAY4D9C5_9TELE
VAEDHGLGDGDGTIDVAQCLELLLLAVAVDVILLDCVQGLLLPFQFDDVGFGDYSLGKVPHALLKRGGKQQHLTVLGQHPRMTWKPVKNPPLDADALVLVTLCGNHDVGLVQHKHLDLLGVDEPEFRAPVQHCTRRADHNLFLEGGAGNSLGRKKHEKREVTFPLMTS